MTPHTVASAVHKGGRIVVWAVVLLLGGAVAYATTMVVLNWSAIGV